MLYKKRNNVEEITVIKKFFKKFSNSNFVLGGVRPCGGISNIKMIEYI